MKKIRWIAALGAALSLALCLPALAQTTGVAVDGKTYTFVGSEGTYEADGKTFIIGVDSVTIKEPGQPDRVLSVTHSAEAEVSQDVAVSVETSAEAGTAALADGEVTGTEEICAEQAAESAFVVENRGAIAEYTQSSYAVEAAKADSARFDEYARFGLSYDAANNALYYQGQRVRIFEDTYSLDGQSCVSLEHVDDQGVIDVQARRDMTKKSYRADGSDDLTATLTGLYALTDAEFAARRLADWTQTEAGTASTATSEGEMTLAEKEAFYAPYAAFGLHYDAKADVLTYRGQRVRTFMDIRQSNGETLGGGRFHGVLTQTGFEGGEIDVETIRDYARPNESGDGTLIGLTAEDAR